MTAATPDIAPRYDVRSIAVTSSGVHYGPPVAYRVERAIGPARNGHILVVGPTGPAFEVLPAQLFLSA